MSEMEDLEGFEAGFLAGWYAARGITGRPSHEQFGAALAAYAEFAARPPVSAVAPPAHPPHL